MDAVPAVPRARVAAGPPDGPGVEADQLGERGSDPSPRGGEVVVPAGRVAGPVDRRDDLREPGGVGGDRRSQGDEQSPDARPVLAREHDQEGRLRREGEGRAVVDRDGQEQRRAVGHEPAPARRLPIRHQRQVAERDHQDDRRVHSAVAGELDVDRGDDEEHGRGQRGPSVEQPGGERVEDRDSQRPGEGGDGSGRDLLPDDDVGQLGEGEEEGRVQGVEAVEPEDAAPRPAGVGHREPLVDPEPEIVEPREQQGAADEGEQRRDEPSRPAGQIPRPSRPAGTGRGGGHSVSSSSVGFSASSAASSSALIGAAVG